jgi:hypothetical protein
MGLFGRAAKPSKDEFARLMLDAIRQAGETVPLRYDAAEFRLISEGERSGVFNLANAFDEYCAAAKDKKDGVVRRFTRSWFVGYKDLPEEFADARPDVLPALRSRSYYELVRLRTATEAKAELNWPYQVVAEHFGLSLAYDLPEAIRMISQENLNDWDVSFDDAVQVALSNLAEISQEEFHSPAPGVWVSPWRDNHDAARLMLPDVIRRHEVKGDYVAMVPNRDTLLLTGTADDDGLAVMAELSEEALNGPRPLLGLAVRQVDGRWQPYLPEPEHPLHHRFKALWLQSLAQDYAEQHELLARWFEKRNEDVFIAKFSVIQHKDTGQVQSYAVWSQGVDALLPRTDLVFFFRPDPAKGQGEGDILSGPWHRVREVVGSLMEPADTYPERYRVKQFPTRQQLAVITGQP